MIREKNDRSIIGKFARYSEVLNLNLFKVLLVVKKIQIIQIQSFIEDTVAGNPDLASSYLAGQTYEKRNIKVVVLKTPSSSKRIWMGKVNLLIYLKNIK